VHRLLVLLSALLVASSSRRIESACCAAIGPRQVDSVQSSSLSTHLSFLCKATILGCGLSDLYRKIPPKKGQISFSSNFVLSALQPRARFIISFDPTTNTNGNGHPEYAHTGNRNPSPILTYCLSSRSCAHTQFLRNQLQSGRLSWWRGGTNREENIRRMAPEMDGPLAHGDYFTWFSLCTPITKTLYSSFEPLIPLAYACLDLLCCCRFARIRMHRPTLLARTSPKPNSNPINRLDYRDG